MKIPLFAKYPNLTWRRKNILPIYPKSPKSTSTLVVEPLENRLLLSIINFADQTEVEIEPNNVTPGQELIFGPDTLALGLIGEYLARIFDRSMDRPPYVVGESLPERKP